ncbi:NAD(P)-dependent oxidoreductase [Acidisoma sp. S159]|uniref:NAD-dependent epimerase/dehydratase family protein n=1 Tax=Acidisoma sp. S159 TaxID=1747225 RepID=UPI00131B8020|nr:NAD(P)-dependent oxidoreductase [Acidisoma sp. S159]
MSRIFLAGGTGIIGQSLVPLLRGAGHFVVGTTRSGEGKAKLEAMGIDAVIINVFDAEALRAAVTAAAPDVLIHQLTDLAAGIDPAAPEEAIRRNAHLRREGTANVVAAARTAGVKRMIAQSIAWAYAPKPLPFIESDPLDVNATGSRAISILDGIVPLENAVLDQNDFEGFVLRYGQLYGPGTWSAEPDGSAPVHVEAAAYAAFLAVDHGRPGAYNIADPGGAVAIDRAVRELGWRRDYRRHDQA